MICIKSVARVLSKELPNEVLSHFRDIIPIGRREVVGAVFDHVKQLLVVLFVKRGETTKSTLCKLIVLQDIENNTYTPIIDFHSVTFSLKNFWCYVTRGAACSSSEITLEEPGKTEVGNLDDGLVVFRVVEQVFRLFQFVSLILTFKSL